MAELYLIAHKVRGEPAFDIAEKLQIGDEEGWIIPTSGHRAYPYWQQPLDEILQDDMKDCSAPPDWPDHYPCNNPKPKERAASGANLLSALGLARPAQPVRRI